MPKQSLVINNFHGGLNNNADPRDIRDDQASDIKDFKISKLGQLTLLGKFASAGYGNNTESLVNRGLFVVGSDRKVTFPHAESEETLVFAYDVLDNKIDIKDSGGWNQNEINLNTTHPVFYSSDGVVRIGDGTFTNQGRWFGYKESSLFSSSAQADISLSGWIETSQSILSPTEGICLVSTPHIGSDTNGVNSPNAEYIGDRVDGSGSPFDVAVDEAINLRVGLQFAVDRSGPASGHILQSGVASCTDSGLVYSLFDGNNVKVVGNASTVEIRKNTGLTLTEDKNILFGFFQRQSEYDKLESVKFTYTENASTDTLSWEFPRELIKPECWNVLSMSMTNITEGDADGVGLDTWKFEVFGTASLEYFFNGIVIANNPTLQGYPEGMYTFHHSYLYDESKQESIPFQFADTDTSYNYNKINIVGNSVLFNFDIYCCPYIYNVPDRIDASDHQIDDTNHGLPVGTPVYISGATNAVWTNANTDLFFVSSESYSVDSFRLSTSKANAIAGTSISMTGTDDTSGVHYYTYGIDRRVSGSRIYYKKEENDNFFLIGELDFDNTNTLAQGFKWFPESSTASYSFEDTGNTAGPILNKTAIIKSITPDSANTVDTFTSINGYGSGVRTVEARYKTAVVHGRRTYIGNIKQDGVIHSDRMIKSRVNKFDTFPSNIGVVDVAIRDGESIVKLEAFADRILQFKQKSLYVINVSENVDFLEDVYRNKGCEFDYHVFKTDYGVTWFNKFGVYLFDGKTVANLLEKDGVRLISESSWESFITSNDPDTSECHMGYIPTRRQIIIKNSDTKCFIYDLVLRAWTVGATGTVTVSGGSSGMTNFALDENQNLFYLNDFNPGFNQGLGGDANEIKKWTWDNTSAQQSPTYISKDIDFGHPSIRKKVYRVRISYKGRADNVQVRYLINGDTDTYYNFCGTNSDGTTNNVANPKPLLDKSADISLWWHADLKPATSSVANNIYSFKFAITFDGGTAVGSTFAINDITFIYRLKNVK